MWIYNIKSFSLKDIGVREGYTCDRAYREMLGKKLRLY